MIHLATLLAQVGSGTTNRNKALVWAGITVVLIVLIGFNMRERLLRWARNKEVFRGLSYLLEPLLAAALSVAAGLWDIWRATVWESDAPQLVSGLPVWAGILTLYGGIKVLSGVAKEKDQKEIHQLRASVASETKTVKYLTAQRDRWALIFSYIRRIVTGKTARLTKLLNERRPVEPHEVLTTLAPEKQIAVTISSIHEFFKARQSPNSSLRLGICARDPEDREKLTFAFQYDGEFHDCFNRDAAEKYMNLLDPGAIKSAVVALYLNNENFRVISDCQKAAGEGSFFFFYPEQAQNVHSMMLYKHVFWNGEENDAMVLMLVTSETGFFKEEEAEELKQFVVEMMARIEYESIVLELIKKLKLGEGEVTQ